MSALSVVNSLNKAVDKADDVVGPQPMNPRDGKIVQSRIFFIIVVGLLLGGHAIPHLDHWLHFAIGIFLLARHLSEEFEIKLWPFKSTSNMAVNVPGHADRGPQRGRKVRARIIFILMPGLLEAPQNHQPRS
jgi:hypothetical protein